MFGCSMISINVGGIFESCAVTERSSLCVLGFFIFLFEFVFRTHFLFVNKLEQLLLVLDFNFFFFFFFCNVVLFVSNFVKVNHITFLFIFFLSSSVFFATI